MSILMTLSVIRIKVQPPLVSTRRTRSDVHQYTLDLVDLSRMLLLNNMYDIMIWYVYSVGSACCSTREVTSKVKEEPSRAFGLIPTSTNVVGGQQSALKIVTVAVVLG